MNVWGQSGNHYSFKNRFKLYLQHFTAQDHIITREGVIWMLTIAWTLELTLHSFSQSQPNSAHFHCYLSLFWSFTCLFTYYELIIRTDGKSLQIKDTVILSISSPHSVNMYSLKNYTFWECILLELLVILF